MKYTLCLQEYPGENVYFLVNFLFVDQHLLLKCILNPEVDRRIDISGPLWWLSNQTSHSINTSAPRTVGGSR